jgi:hypothetical protein
VFAETFCAFAIIVDGLDVQYCMRWQRIILSRKTFFLTNDIIGVGLLRLKAKKFTHECDLFMSFRSNTQSLLVLFSTHFSSEYLSTLVHSQDLSPSSSIMSSVCNCLNQSNLAWELDHNRAL